MIELSDKPTELEILEFQFGEYYCRPSLSQKILGISRSRMDNIIAKKIKPLPMLYMSFGTPLKGRKGMMHGVKLKDLLQFRFMKILLKETNKRSNCCVVPDDVVVKLIREAIMDFNSNFRADPR